MQALRSPLRPFSWSSLFHSLLVSLWLVLFILPTQPARHTHLDWNPNGRSKHSVKAWTALIVTVVYGAAHIFCAVAEQATTTAIPLPATRRVPSRKGRARPILSEPESTANFILSRDPPLCATTVPICLKIDTDIVYVQPGFVCVLSSARPTNS